MAASSVADLVLAGRPQRGSGSLAASQPGHAREVPGSLGDELFVCTGAYTGVHEKFSDRHAIPSRPRVTHPRVRAAEVRRMDGDRSRPERVVIPTRLIPRGSGEIPPPSA